MRTGGFSRQDCHPSEESRDLLLIVILSEGFSPSRRTPIPAGCPTLVRRCCGQGGRKVLDLSCWPTPQALFRIEVGSRDFHPLSLPSSRQRRARRMGHPRHPASHFGVTSLSLSLNLSHVFFSVGYFDLVLREQLILVNLSYHFPARNVDEVCKEPFLEAIRKWRWA